jgi:hypothetical protein
VHLQRLKLAVVQAGAAQFFIIQIKTQGLYQMESKAGIGAEANNIARIGGDFGLIEHYVKHNFLFARRDLYYRINW